MDSLVNYIVDSSSDYLVGAIIDVRSIRWLCYHGWPMLLLALLDSTHLLGASKFVGCLEQLPEPLEELRVLQKRVTGIRRSCPVPWRLDDRLQPLWPHHVLRSAPSSSFRFGPDLALPGTSEHCIFR